MRFPDWETGRLAVLWDSPTSHLYLNCFPEPYVFGALCKQQPKTTGGRRTSFLELRGKWEACQPHSRSKPRALHGAQGQVEARERMGRGPPGLHTLWNKGNGHLSSMLRTSTGQVFRKGTTCTRICGARRMGGRSPPRRVRLVGEEFR